MDPDHDRPSAVSPDVTDPSATTAWLAGMRAGVLNIEQAAGILVTATGRTEAEAIDMLRQVSKRRNVPVRDLAAWLTARAVGNTEP